MKKKTICLIIILLIIAFNVWFWFFYKNNKGTDNNNNFSNTTVEITSEMQTLFDKLEEIGTKLYDSGDYKKFTKKDEINFITLKDLNEKYNYDISVFKIGDNTCDINESGIYFDVKNRIYDHTEDENCIVPLLIGCEEVNTEVDTKKEEEINKIINDKEYVVNFDSTTKGVFIHDGSVVTDYSEYIYDKNANLDVYNNLYGDNEYIIDVVLDDDHIVLKYKLEYVEHYYGSNNIKDVISFFMN